MQDTLKRSKELCDNFHARAAEVGYGSAFLEVSLRIAMLEQSQEEMWAFKDELVTEIAKLYARIPAISHHGNDAFRSYAAELVGKCHQAAAQHGVQDDVAVSQQSGINADDDHSVESPRG